MNWTNSQLILLIIAAIVVGIRLNFPVTEQSTGMWAFQFFVFFIAFLALRAPDRHLGVNVLVRKQPRWVFGAVLASSLIFFAPSTGVWETPTELLRYPIVGILFWRLFVRTERL